MADLNQNYVGGEWVSSETGETFEVHNPAAPDETVASYQQSSAADAAEAVEAAADAQDEWATTPGPERGRILRKAGTILADRKDELTAMLVEEEGKARPEAAGEVQRAIDIFHYFAGKASDLGGTMKGSSSRDTTLYTREEPVGVAALITPWNYPIAIPVWKLAPALAAGNSVVIKPASAAPGVVFAVTEALDEAGLPDGVLNVVTGPGSSVGNEFITNEGTDAVSFTGSGQVGEMVYDQATDAGKRVQTEMGGKNPTLVTDSADPAEAAEIVATGGFGTTGQSCTACSRAVVHEDVYDEFVEQFVDAVESFTVGDPMDPETDVGPQARQELMEDVHEQVAESVDAGATVETGGEPLDREGAYYPPTVLTDVPEGSPADAEEVFGPVAAVFRVSDGDAAVEKANDTQFGLGASIWTNDLARGERVARRIDAGCTFVNELVKSDPRVPFGGVKESGYGRELAAAGITEFVNRKTIWSQNPETTDDEVPTE